MHLGPQKTYPPRYLLGYAFSYGASLDTRLKNQFIGNYVFALHRIREYNHNTTSFGYAWFIQSFFYALVCNAIVADAMGVRASRLAHILSTIYTVSFLFPVIVHWVWSTEGWLSAIRPENVEPVGTIGAIDFAGSGVVHMLGGVISLAASIFLRKAEAPKAPAEDQLSLTLGGFLRVFAMYSFVTGSTIAITLGSSGAMTLDSNVISALGGLTPAIIATDGNDMPMFVAAGRAAVCLTLSIAASALAVLLLESFLSKEVNLTHGVNGLTVGFAAISSNILTCEPWAALIAGLVGGMIYVFGRRMFKGLRDNDVFVIHGLGGFWGLMFTACLAKPKFIRDVIGYNFYPNRVAIGRALGGNFGGQVLGLTPFTRQGGVFYPKKGPNGKLLGTMLLESVAVFMWGLVMALPLFGILAAMKKLQAVPAKEAAADK